MCGICGIHGINENKNQGFSLQKMVDALSHRGPDFSGTYVDNTVALGHTRLSIIDLSGSANQPMSDPSGRYTLVFNGEIYNYRQLRKSFNRYPFQSNSDSEVLLAGLVKWGIKFLNECNGMFAFALWDTEKQELTLARDRMGIKPLYYARTGLKTVFASEIRSILSSGLISPELNKDSLGDYLRYQTVHGTNTILSGIYMVAPGSVLTITDNEYHSEIYWSPESQLESGVQNMSYGSVKGLVQEKLNAAVKRRLISDVPMGAFLSGGIDSSAIVALASQHVSGPLKTFNINFQEGEFSEARYAKQVAEMYQTEHCQIDLDPHILIDKLPAVLDSMDHPSGDGVNSYVVSEAAKQAGITVALSGLGGDELFAGYPIFSQFYDLRDKGWLMSFPKFIRSLAGSFYTKLKPGIGSEKINQIITEDYLDLEYVYQYSREVLSRENISDILDENPRGMNAVFDLVQGAVGVETPGFKMTRLSKVSYAEISTYLQSVLLRDTDQMSMAHALEVRVPFLDHELVSLALSISDNHKYPSSPKKLLVDSLGDYLPKEVYERKKMGFTFPWKVWMKNELKEFCGDSLLDLARRTEFSEKSVLSRWDKFLNDDPSVSWSRIWYLCILQSWMSRNGVN